MLWTSRLEDPGPLYEDQKAHGGATELSRRLWLVHLERATRTRPQPCDLGRRILILNPVAEHSPALSLCGLS